MTLIITTAVATAEDCVLYNRDVRPILAEHCWQCHGPDKEARQAGLRLDIGEHALKKADSGKHAISPGSVERSELVRRITSRDGDVQMPPADFGKPLSAKQIASLKRWIAQGAKYEQHWSFQPIERPTPPSSRGANNAIDAFVGEHLQRQGKDFAPPASREKLLRRVSLVLTGLPPSLAELDRTEEPYSQAVDRLLNSPHYGEHMAVSWLDAARYADTNGYFGDRPRQMWLWRDWVIDAFNQNMPFDQFTIEQLAADLFPNFTRQQLIATGFNRNHMANNETGIIDEEFRVEYIVDRVDTTMTTWLGLTVGCAQCHDHKYDPISQREFYQLFAFFNNSPDKGLITAENPAPKISVTTPEIGERFSKLQMEAAVARAAFDKLRPSLLKKMGAWETSIAKKLPLPPSKNLLLHERFEEQDTKRVGTLGNTPRYEAGILGQSAHFDATGHLESTLENFDADKPWTLGFWAKPDGSMSCLMSKIESKGRRRGFELLLQKGRVIVNLVHHWGADAIEVVASQTLQSRQWQHVVVSYDGTRKASGVKIFIDGQPSTLTVRRDTLTGGIANNETLKIGRRDEGLGYYGSLDELRLVQQMVPQNKVVDWYRGERLAGIFKKDKKSSSDKEFLFDDYIERQTSASVRTARQEMLRTQAAVESFREAIPTTLIMQDLPESRKRKTHVLIRGQYDKLGEAVTADVPAVLPPLANDVRRDRLGMARWLMSKENPLTARVIANRLWQHCFGEGLVRTMNDFGTQGEPPTHPALLDWLAAELRDSGWDVKRLLRLIVTSRTFRQESRFRNGPSFDPGNRLLARGPSYRMSAEMIRDQALVVSGLLERKIGGPSVKPYQPPGLWEEVSYNADTSYQPDTGPNLWRRSVYTYIKRQAPPPAFLAFDGVTREKCTIQRARTNTPLQALILLNDPTFVEASIVIAERALTKQANDTDRMRRLFRRIVSRWPDNEEIRLLQSFLKKQRQRFEKAPKSAANLLTVGDSKRQLPASNIEVAAWTVVAQTLLNLDEVIQIR
ncbi:MAG: hypothetical protein CMJ78_14595 [Planctomycetaceae bacterium]|nr:hypothetical protein [Planctomycetaceae bacterium]